MNGQMNSLKGTIVFVFFFLAVFDAILTCSHANVAVPTFAYVNLATYAYADQAKTTH